MTTPQNENILKQAIQFHQQNKFKEALDLYNHLLKEEHQNQNLNFYVGTLFLQLNQFNKAINHLKLIINQARNKNDEILVHALNNMGSCYISLKDNEKALIYLNKAISINNNFFLALLNRVKICLEDNKLDSAKNDLERLKNINSNDSDLLNEFGNYYNKINQSILAIKHYELSIKSNPKNFFPYYNLGIIYEKIGDYENSLRFLIKSSQLNPNFNYLLGKILHLKMYLCDWKNYNDFINKIYQRIDTINPFISISIVDDISYQKKIAVNYSQKSFKNNIKLDLSSYNNKKIKVAYFSSDFREHAFTQLFKSVLENHNLNDFEIYGFYFGPKEGKEIRDDLKKYFKEFFEVTNKSTQEIINLSRQLKIQIAVNCNGFTKFSRNEIFDKRLAPLQINYLGYPGTMGSENFDYIIADKIIIPEHLKKYYSEKVIYLEQCYQPNSRIINNLKAEETTRKDFNLPQDGFIYCNLNNNFKITPNIYKVWMNILRNTKNSYLCLLVSNNDIAKNNIRKLTSELGINPDRVLFTPRTNNREHLNRFALMDLFLDTFPYGAHTTASECLRSGLPIITLQGDVFASRVSSSLLNHLGINELINNSIEMYEEVAIDLCCNKAKYNQIKNLISEKIHDSSLYDPIKYTLNLESVYRKLVNK